MADYTNIDKFTPLYTGEGWSDTIANYGLYTISENLTQIQESIWGRDVRASIDAALYLIWYNGYEQEKTIQNISDKLSDVAQTVEETAARYDTNSTDANFRGVIIGEGDCSATGAGSVSAGQDSVISADLSFGFGMDLISTHEGQFIIGYNNVDVEDAYFIIGNGANPNERHNLLTINADGTITVNDKTITLGDSAAWYYNDGTGVVAGSDTNVASGAYSFVCGKDNTGTSLYDFVAGDGNTVKSIAGYAFGVGNTVTGRGSGAFGDSNTVNMADSCAFGDGLIVSAFQFAFGIYNEEDAYSKGSTKGKAALVIGDGTSDTDRHNLCSINWDGTITINDVDYSLESMQNAINNISTSGAVSMTSSDLADICAYAS